MKTIYKIPARLLYDPKANTYKVVWFENGIAFNDTEFFEKKFNSFSKAQLFMSNLK